MRTADVAQLLAAFAGSCWDDPDSGHVLSELLTTPPMDVSASLCGPKSVAGRIFLAACSYMESVAPYGHDVMEESIQVLEEDWERLCRIVCPDPLDARAVMSELDRFLCEGRLPRALDPGARLPGRSL